MITDKEKRLDWRADKSINKVDGLMQKFYFNEENELSPFELDLILGFIHVFNNSYFWVTGLRPTQQRAYDMAKSFVRSEHHSKLIKLLIEEGDYNIEEGPSEMMREFVGHFKTHMDRFTTYKASLIYVNLYLRSMAGDERALNEAMAILKGSKKAEELALKIYNQGFNFQDLKEVEDQERMWEFITRNITSELSYIQRFNDFLGKFTELEEVKHLAFIACNYISEEDLDIESYKESKEELESAIKHNRPNKLNAIQRAFPYADKEFYCTEPGGEKRPYSLPPESVKKQKKELRERAKPLYFWDYFTSLY